MHPLASDSAVRISCLDSLIRNVIIWQVYEPKIFLKDLKLSAMALQFAAG